MVSAGSELVTVVEAITTRSPITFTYIGQDLENQKRTLNPYALASRDGFWYFAGMDLDKGAIRTFRLDRVEGEIAVGKKNASFEIPAGFDLFSHLDEGISAKLATIDIRKGKAFALRKKALSVVEKGEWDKITIQYGDDSTFIDSLLWHLDDVVVIEPSELRESVVKILSSMVVNHG